MTYKKQFTILSGIIAALAVIYIASFIFDPERRGARSAAYSWLDPAEAGRISGITITHNDTAITLSRNGGAWFVSREGTDYPAKAVRVEDFIAAMTKRAPYPVRSSSGSSHERLALTEDAAARVTVAAGAGLPVLSLLVGDADATGQNIYLRKQGENEVRSGEDIFSGFAKSTPESWYDLRLFPESETGTLNAADVQRLTVYEGDAPPRVFTREGNAWTLNFEVTGADSTSVLSMAKVDNYIRDILGASGDNFIHTVTPSDSMFNDSRIVLELGDGGTTTIRLAPPDENGARYATVSGMDWVFSIPAWVSQRLFPNPEDFAAETAEQAAPAEQPN